MSAGLHFTDGRGRTAIEFVAAYGAPQAGNLTIVPNDSMSIKAGIFCSPIWRGGKPVFPTN